jgi:hypothetical protein
MPRGSRELAGSKVSISGSRLLLSLWTKRRYRKQEENVRPPNVLHLFKWRIEARMKRTILAVAVSAMLFGAMGTGSVSARKDPACTVTPDMATVGQTYTVSVAGIPANASVYLWVTDAKTATISSSYLGTTSTGSFSLAESASNSGLWSYQFTGPQKGNTTVYATCSVNVN